jgi:hypothetical protein
MREAKNQEANAAAQRRDTRRHQLRWLLRLRLLFCVLCVYFLRFLGTILEKIMVFWGSSCREAEKNAIKNRWENTTGKTNLSTFSAKSFDMDLPANVCFLGCF